MPLSPDELAQISALTLAHYQSSAEDFREGTRDHDVSQNIAALLRHIEGEKPWRILDFGCGPGRRHHRISFAAPEWWKYSTLSAWRLPFARSARWRRGWCVSVCRR